MNRDDLNRPLKREFLVVLSDNVELHRMLNKFIRATDFMLEKYPCETLGCAPNGFIQFDIWQALYSTNKEAKIFKGEL